MCAVRVYWRRSEEKMANQQSTVVLGAGSVGGGGGPGGPFPQPMEVEGSKGSVTTLGKAGPSG